MVNDIARALVAASLLALMSCQTPAQRSHATDAEPLAAGSSAPAAPGRASARVASDGLPPVPEEPPPNPPKLIPDPPRKELSIVVPRSLESLQDDGKHDSSNDALAVLQDPREAMHDFPLDRRQAINWVKTLDQGLIEPRASLDGKGEMLEMDMDILFTNTKDMPYVRFPHLQHTRWLDCSNCHPRIFIPRRGANPVSMNEVLRGKFCGVCHDKVAFSLFVCERCHSVPHEGSGKWW